MKKWRKIRFFWLNYFNFFPIFYCTFYYLPYIIYSLWQTKTLNYIKLNNKLGFDYYESHLSQIVLRVIVVDFLSSPIKDYGLTQKQVDQMVKVNGLEEELGIWSDFA